MPIVRQPAVAITAAYEASSRWDKLAAIPAQEISAIQQLAASSFASMPYPYLRGGERVRITDGPLAGLEGAYVRSRRNQGLLVLSIELLNRSVAVEIDGAAIEPVNAAVRSSFGACL